MENTPTTTPMTTALVPYYEWNLNQIILMGYLYWYMLDGRSPEQYYG